MRIPFNFKFVFLSIGIVLLLASCKQVHKAPAGNVLILFDDYNVENWLKYQDSLEKYGITATFYVSHFHRMDERSLLGLETLRAQGHEIGYHTLNHPQDVKSYNPHQVQVYLHREIDSGLQLMKASHFEPQCFAFACDAHTPTLFDSLHTRFLSVCSGSFGFFEYWKRRHEYTLLADQPDNFRCYDVGLNSRFASDDNMLMMADDVAHGKNIALLLHSFDDSTSTYTTPSSEFFKMIRMFHRQGARFKTVGDFFYPDQERLYTAKKD
ncbi:MAG: polysaccharide deacetylase family protein [Bacteroidetes bacterium]|nr:polysaccharide deacetylase family protein [Bacteroidota bacterium]